MWPKGLVRAAIIDYDGLMTNAATTAPAASDFVLTEREWADSEDEALRAEMAEMDAAMADHADHADAVRRNSSRNPAHWTAW